MRKTILFFTLSLLAITSHGQYPFEKYPSISYKKFSGWNILNKGDRIHATLLIPKFYNNGDSLIVQSTSFPSALDSSIIRLYRNKKLIQKVFEPSPLEDIQKEDTLFVADFNGDSLPDIKMNIMLPYNGITYQRVIYLFQNKEATYTKVSFTDMSNDNSEAINFPERDFDNDHNFEIITLILNNYEHHNYLTYNLYNYINGGFICVNDKFDYPIMFQFLNGVNYKQTDKISNEKRKEFSTILPNNYDRK